MMHNSLNLSLFTWSRSIYSPLIAYKTENYTLFFAPTVHSQVLKKWIGRTNLRSFLKREGYRGFLFNFRAVLFVLYACCTEYHRMQKER